ncbi:hypothetical protein PMI15_03877 [Polaromonas sp. CF318]|uniref:hypothetical protein n=1 Tax=Polaromonas sp. CF318 TaxID=1144318 RepID=UPI000271182A|nr:hypothetical protein [Polaromonas sp. CF318]EJL80437.1 hypothetical protein PMI15_03877 [Polaromonas sp. CF318]
MFLDSFPREEAQDSRAMRPVREPAAEPARSRHPWPFPVSGKDFGLPAAKPQAVGGPGYAASGSSFVT